MPDDVKPSNSHSALSNVGDDFKVIRDNMPFGTVGNNENGHLLQLLCQHILNCGEDAQKYVYRRSRRQLRQAFRFQHRHNRHALLRTNHGYAGGFSG